MPRWFPAKRWAGADVFIIGGGPSLRGFDFARLRGQRTIGCNSAFLLGAELCNVCFFSDAPFLAKYETQLEQFAGPVVTHSTDVDWRHPWVLRMEKHDEGLHHDALGFGYNSGCSAVNLALLLGAARVILLGFDCKVPAGQPTHWHDRAMEPTHPDVFPKFMDGWRAIARTLPVMFPRAEVLTGIVNSIEETDLKLFPHLYIDEVL